MAAMTSQPPMSPHKAEACATLSPIGQKLFRFIEFDDNEELLAEIRKHPIGLFFILVTGFFITAVILVAAGLLATHLSDLSLDAVDSGSSIQGIIIVIGVVLAALSIFMTLIVAILYRSNVVFVTNEKIAEVMYVSIFNRRIMQLGIGNVEDITVTQKGILPRLFDYGGLIIETAGEIKNPAFTYVPKPNENAQLITRDHEQYVEKYGN